MYLKISKNAEELGLNAAKYVGDALKKTIEENGYARIVLSTGASQFETLKYLVQRTDIDWSCVEMFHLDEYVNLPETHIASFRKYLKERFVDLVHPKEFHYVDGLGDVEENLAKLTAELRKAPIDVGLIGIGENGHIAFNDPPADFDTTAAYKIVELDEKCRRQQMGEGWFATIDDVPKSAISMTVYQMMQCKTVLTICGGTRKAEAIKKTLEAPAVTNMVPATKLKEHTDWTLFLDEESASLVNKDLLK